MHNTEMLTIHKVLYESSLKINETGRSTLNNYNIQAQVSVLEIQLPNVKTCITAVKYVILFKMLTERWLEFVERGSADFILSMLRQKEVADISFSRAEPTADNFINIYWDLEIRINNDRRE